VFLSFTGEPASLKLAIRELAKSVTSADAQAQQTARHKQDRTESIFVGFGLSACGYRFLGYNPDVLKSAEFSDGMTRPGSGLYDPDVSQWEKPFQKPIHAMVVLAHSNSDELMKQANALLAPFAGLADTWTECGSKILKGKETIEQFGFVDGISQPIFFRSDIKGRIEYWDPGAGTRLVLVKDEFGKSDDDCGSFYVFRKLEQDVKGFDQRVACLQAQLGHRPNRELAGALLVGRFQDGTPVVHHDSPQGNTDNDFIYIGRLLGSGADPFDRKCPISSHIRKVNPRGGTSDIEKERNRRIARRGITYGDAKKDENVGLLFQCCQSDLANQFEFLQATWSNTAGKPDSTGTDPIAAQSAPQNQVWPLIWGTGHKVAFDFGGFVRLKGGAYFFLPSITFLKNI
jgi:Dyp-type peroxidase family